MAVTYLIEDGDLRKDGVGRLKETSESTLLRQHVLMQILNNVKPEIVNGLGDPFAQFIEGLISLRIRSRLETLQSELLQYGIVRDASEKIRSIDVVIAKRTEEDPRSIKFWVRVIADGRNTEDVSGEV